MRIIHRLSFSISLVDAFKKEPISNAIVFCNDKRLPYVKKDYGRYLFFHLNSGDYKINIFAEGYVDKELKFFLEKGKTKNFMLDMSFDSSNSKIVNLPRIEFVISKDKKLLKSKEIKLLLKTNVKLMKLIQKIKSGDHGILLNINEDESLFPQRYVYRINDEKNEEYKLFLIGYDRKSKLYILDEPVSEDIKIGGNFYLYWNLKIDKKGKIVFPFINWLSNIELKFEIQIDNKKINVKANLEKFNYSHKILTVRVNF